MKPEKPKKEKKHNQTGQQQSGQQTGQNMQLSTQTNQQPEIETPSAPPPSTPPLTPEQQKIQDEMNAKIKEIENAVHAVRFYPVAANEEAKNSALAKLETMYKTENETLRQLLLYMLHETLTASMELRIMHTFEYFKMKNQKAEPNQNRMNVYRSMFNYQTSIEGLIEIIKLLGRFDGDDAAKLLTYHFSHLCAMENEANHILRSALLEALGNSNSTYALNALISYAEYTDSEYTFNRTVSALKEWDNKLDKTKLPEKEKEKVRVKMKEFMSRDMTGSHYG